MINRPSEQEQVDIIIKNLLPVYQQQLQTQYLPTFQSLIATATKVEDLIQMGQLKEDSGTSKYKKPSQPGKVHEVASITPTNPLLFREAVKANYIKPLEARPPPNPLPRNYRADEYYLNDLTEEVDAITRNGRQY
ncbi:hypothetical protein JCGZ_23919 [Jatropha curcas]|uniref:Uncharacterized protein n=1 Tax=Jatropha curcas TaxID=180498 RepID=A0A067K265_JATCU|nr:hypothetical protein JCGZ_23919 [Jatropha curcas]